MSSDVYTLMCRFILAANHFIRTGVEIGDGIVCELSAHEDRVELLFQVDLHDPDSQADFECLRSRLSELSNELGVTLEDRGIHLWFQAWGLDVDRDKVEDLVSALTERPGVLGWGSTYKIARRHLRYGYYPEHGSLIDVR